VTDPIIARARETIRGHEAHWLEQATLLAMIEDNGLWRGTDPPYTSFEYFVVDDLGISTDRMASLMKAFRFLQGTEPVTLSEWAGVPLPTVRHLRRLGPVDGNRLLQWARHPSGQHEWLNGSEMEAFVNAKLGKEKWVRWGGSVPGLDADGLDGMLLRVLPDVLGHPYQEGDELRLHDRAIFFRCMRLIAAFVGAGYVAGGQEAGEYAASDPMDSVLRLPEDSPGHSSVPD
jgi:hypothetical protein